MRAKLRLVQLFVLLTGLASLASGCGDNSNLSPCDIRRKSCQDAIFYEVQKLRGTEWDPWIDRPPMRVISAKEYRNELLDAQKRDEQRAMQNMEQVDHFQVALELLALLDPNRTKTAEVDTRVDNVAAFYSLNSKSVTIIDHGKPGDLEYGTSVLAHELVHAAQDREIGLSTYALPSTVDADYARSAIIEGEARLYENVLMIGAVGRTIDDVDWDHYHGLLLDDARQRIFDADSPYLQLYGLMYAVGSRFLTDRYLAGGNVSVRDAWQKIPTEMHFFIDREDTSDANPQPRLMEGDPGYSFVAQGPLPCRAPKPPADYEVYADTSLGALFVFGVATRFADDPGAAWVMARAFVADHLSIYFNESEETLVSWQIRLKKSQATTFADKLAEYYGPDAIATSGNQINVMLHDAETAPDWNAWKKCATVN